MKLLCPTRLRDPEGFRRFERLRVDMLVTNERMNSSERFADERARLRDKVTAANGMGHGVMDSDPRHLRIYL